MPDPTDHTLQLAGRGILFMLVGIGTLSLMDAAAKWLVMDSIPAIQLIAVRSLLIVPVMLLAFAVRGKLADLRPRHPLAQLLRGAAGITAPLCFFVGVARMPLSTGVTVFFSSIFMVSLLSIFWLGERVGPRRWAAICIGYTGVFIAMSPTGGGDALGYALVLLASLAYAMVFVSGRYLSRTDSVPSLVFSFNLGIGLVACISLPWVWQAMNGVQTLVIVLIAALALAGHYCLTVAFSLCEASLIAPFEYTAILWAILLDLLLWQTLPGSRTWVGAAIIIGSGLYVIYREHRVQSRTAAEVLPDQGL